MSKLEHLAERVDRLVLRHHELQRRSALVEQTLAAVTTERDSLRSRLAAARARIDALLQRLPATSAATPDAPSAARQSTGAASTSIDSSPRRQTDSEGAA